jgi:glycine/sarcosine N-methyltransferase
MSGIIEGFYDGLAAYYHLLFADWHASIQRQAEVLDQLVRHELGSGSKRLLDCSCGIGTQAIGLALKGHAVTATDVSPEAVHRARDEAARFDLEIDFRVCDMRELPTCVEGGFDVVISCDNSLPHLLEVEDLARAVAAIHSRLNPDGVFVASTRDYDTILRDRPEATPVGLDTIEGTRRLTFQVWEWAQDGRTYEYELFIGEETGGDWDLRSWRSKYRAITRDELSAILRENGFNSVRWIMPSESGFFQPLVIARTS